MAAKAVQPEGLVGSLQSEVAAEASPLLNFLVAHALKIVAGIVLFIAAIAAYWLYSAHAESAKAEEARLLGQYLIISDPAMRLQKLEEFAPQAPDSVKKALNFAIMEAATQLQDHEKTYAAWKVISEDKTMRPTAFLGMAGALANLGRFNEALDLLVSLAPDLQGGDSILINSRLVGLAEVTGDLDKALAACDAMIGQASDPRESMMWTQKRDDLARKMQAASAQEPAARTDLAEQP